MGKITRDNLHESLLGVIENKKTYKKILHNLPMNFGEDYQYIVNYNGCTYMYPQAFAIEGNEIFIFYCPGGTITLQNRWVAVFDRTTGEYKSCFSVGLSGYEGIEVITEDDGSRYIYVKHNNAGDLGKFNITNFPANRSVLEPEELIPLKISSNFSYDPVTKKWLIEAMNKPLGITYRRNTLALYDKDFNLLSYLNMSLTDVNYANSSTAYQDAISKRQGLALHCDKIYQSMGGYWGAGEEVKPYSLAGIKVLSLNGQVKDEMLINPSKFRARLLEHNVPCTRIEYEGVKIVDGKIITVCCTVGRTDAEYTTHGVVVFEEQCPDGGIDFADCIEGQVTINEDIIDTELYPVINDSLINLITNEEMTTLPMIFDYMKEIDLKSFNFYTSSLRNKVKDVNGLEIPNAILVTIRNVNNNTMFVEYLDSQNIRNMKYIAYSSGDVYKTNFLQLQENSYFITSDELYDVLTGEELSSLPMIFDYMKKVGLEDFSFYTSNIVNKITDVDGVEIPNSILVNIHNVNANTMFVEYVDAQNIRNMKYIAYLSGGSYVKNYLQLQENPGVFSIKSKAMYDALTGEELSSLPMIFDYMKKVGVGHLSFYTSNMTNKITDVDGSVIPNSILVSIQNVNNNTFFVDWKSSLSNNISYVCYIPTNGNTYTKNYVKDFTTKTYVGDKDALLTENKTDIVAAINEVFQSGVNAKQQLVDALTAKGLDVSTSMNWEELINNGVNNMSGGGSLDIISATELPATGKENQICVVTQNPVDNFVVTPNYADKSANSDVITLYVGNTSSMDTNLGASYSVQNGSVTTNYYFNRVCQGEARLGSYIYQNSQWSPLTVPSIVIMENMVYHNTDVFDVFHTGQYMDYNAQNGLRFDVYGGTSRRVVGITTKVKINFSDYTKIKLKVCNHNQDNRGYIKILACNNSTYYYSNGDAYLASYLDAVAQSASISTPYSSSLNIMTYEVELDLTDWVGSYYLGIMAGTPYQFGDTVRITDIELY